MSGSKKFTLTFGLALFRISYKPIKMKNDYNCRRCIDLAYISTSAVTSPAMNIGIICKSWRALQSDNVGSC